MKKILLIILIVFLTGCTNTEEDNKSEYIALKSNLLEEQITNEKEELPVDITVNLDRINEEKIDYKVTLDNPKENMHNIKSLVVHNYYSDEIFPSLGVFNQKKELLVDTDLEEKIELTGEIKTIKNISNMNLEIKLWLQYTDDSGEIKEIYYKTT